MVGPAFPGDPSGEEGIYVYAQASLRIYADLFPSMRKFRTLQKGVLWRFWGEKELLGRRGGG